MGEEINRKAKKILVRRIVGPSSSTDIDESADDVDFHEFASGSTFTRSISDHPPLSEEEIQIIELDSDSQRSTSPLLLMFPELKQEGLNTDSLTESMSTSDLTKLLVGKKAVFPLLKGCKKLKRAPRCSLLPIAELAETQSLVAKWRCRRATLISEFADVSYSIPDERSSIKCNTDTSEGKRTPGRAAACTNIAAANDNIEAVNDNIASANANVTAAVNNSIATAHGNITAVNDKTAAVNNITATDNNIVAANGNIACTNGNMAPVNNIAGTNGNIVAANENKTRENSNMAAVNNIAGANDNMATVNHNVAGANGNIVAANGNKTGENDNIAAVNNIAGANGNMATVNHDVAAANDKISIVNGNIAAGNGSIGGSSVINDNTNNDNK
ncbi:uncharacterized protein LOC115886182 [Sitophilus oryzae]|uniref:Uncharacterized protein LOC115886182 n=1 Tax=Sitophilus oryzae TaxID=7048 RepID=A0A6J2YCF6_SITOR|nr:uncharacterized protein LOC115886182 [Sitophilus oryzae]